MCTDITSAMCDGKSVKRGARFPAGRLVVGLSVSRGHVAVAAHVLGAVGAGVDGGLVGDAGQRGVEHLRRRADAWAVRQALPGRHQAREHPSQHIPDIRSVTLLSGMP